MKRIQRRPAPSPARATAPGGLPRPCGPGTSRVGVAVVLLALLAATAVPLGGCASGPPEESEVVGELIDLRPQDRVSWSPRNLFAPVTSLFLGGPSYWYDHRRLVVQTTPPGGQVDLFYVRSNFQKRFEQAETPVTVLLPRRIDAGPRDAVTVRAFREGYQQTSVTLKMSSRKDELVLELDPLPNTLVALSHRTFAGRSALSFKTEELPEFRIQESPDGFSLILNETARTPEVAETMEGVSSAQIAAMFGQQLGEDLVVQVELTPAGREAEVRSRQTFDAARELYDFTLELVPEDRGEAVRAARRALAALGPADVSGCRLRFDEVLREQLDAGALSRALTPSGDFTDRYLRAAMRRLGEVTPAGAVAFTDGARYDPTVPIELEAALSQAGGARGFLALLDRFVAGLAAPEHRRETLRSLLAPELDPEAFARALEAARAAEEACRSGGDV